MTADDKRERLAATFNRAAELYQRARPEYPGELYDRLLAVTELSPGARLLEVGCATGKATLPLARRGFRITCLEPGADLAAAARANLAGYNVDVIGERFKDWAPASDRFDMVFAATSWHWVDPTVRYRKAADALKPDGYLALWGAGHVIPCDGDPFFEELQEIYDEIGESLPPDAALPRPQELDDDRDEIVASGLFEVIEIKQYDWETVYDAEGYIDLLNTFSGHIACRIGSEAASTARSGGALPSDPAVACVATGVALSTSPDAARNDIQRQPRTTRLRSGRPPAARTRRA